MLIEGLKLMLMGMGTVMLFLSVMIICINAVTRLNKNNTESELTRLEGEKKKQKVRFKPAAPAQVGDVPIAVFAAAIAAYEADQV